jgi:triosephosphate isomerase
MNTTIDGGKSLVREIDGLIKSLSADVEAVVIPPFTHLCAISGTIKECGSIIKLGAQNCADKRSGAYTGEISAGMLSEVPCQYVIIGHSERREYYGEGNALLLEKVKLVLEQGMTPIYCVGEKLEEREGGVHFDVVLAQIEEVVHKLQESEAANLVIAYEPVWAIGTGKTATAEQAEEMHAHIREVVSRKFGQTAEDIPILYGGSMKPSNAAELLGKANVDGGLIGGASLVAEDFAAIIKSF